MAMQKGEKICKVCGKPYPYCYTLRPSGLFRWQDVACCPEHGYIYFAQVMKARSEASSAQTEVQTTSQPIEDPFIDSDDDEEDEIFTEDEFEDDDDDEEPIMEV